MANAVAIASDLADWLAAQAAASPAEEVCGLLFGGPARIASATACRNVAAETARRFEIDPVALLAAHRAARAGGRAVIGCWHSHPSGGATPSLRDAADAAPDGALWLIATASELRAWRAGPTGEVGGRFDPVALTIDDC